MRAKDTVLEEFQLVARTKLDRDSMLLAQAETTWDIAFKAGYEQARVFYYPVGFADGKRTGIREVVNWIEKTSGHPASRSTPEDLMPHYCPNCNQTIIGVTEHQWQAKLAQDWSLDG